LLSAEEVGRYYLGNLPTGPSSWNHSRKLFRVSPYDGRFVKLDKFKNRLATSPAAKKGKHDVR
jgi:hypothetical protein